MHTHEKNLMFLSLNLYQLHFARCRHLASSCSNKNNSSLSSCQIDSIFTSPSWNCNFFNLVTFSSILYLAFSLYSSELILYHSIVTSFQFPTNNFENPIVFAKHFYYLLTIFVFRSCCLEPKNYLMSWLFDIHSLNG